MLLCWAVAGLAGAAPSPVSALSLTSELPLVVIETGNRAITDGGKVPAHMGVIDHPGTLNRLGDVFDGYDGAIGIRVRGSSSSGFPKVSYTVETRAADGGDVAVSLLGLPKDSDWVLYAPYSDKTLMRDVLALTMARAMGDYASRHRFCELVIDSDYRGVYVLLEKPEQAQHRVDMAQVHAEDLSGDALTGGYLIDINHQEQDGDGWLSAYAVVDQRPYYVCADPAAADLQPEQRAYLEGAVEAFETTLAGARYADVDSGYPHQLEVGSFVDYLIVNEIARNVDAYRLSAYMSKARDSAGGRWRMGPLWDVDLAFGNVDYDGHPTVPFQGDPAEGLQLGSRGVDLLIPFWWRRLAADAAFVQAADQRYRSLRRGVLATDSLVAWVRTTQARLQAPAARNFARWPVLGVYVWPNGYVGQTYNEEVDYLVQWLRHRLDWLDTNLVVALPLAGTVRGGNPVRAPAATPPPVRLNELMAANTLAYPGPQADYPDWLELCSTAPDTVELAGCYLVTGPAPRDRVRLPSAALTRMAPAGHLLLLADGHPERGPEHLALRLPRRGASLRLLAPDGATLWDSTTYGPQYRDLSWGRSPDGTGAWGYLVAATPGAANAAGSPAVTAAPTVNPAPGLYTAPVTATLRGSDAGDLLRYSLDGTVPGDSSAVYTAPIAVTVPTILRARAERVGALPSPVTTVPLLVGVRSSLPVLSVTSEPAGLFDSTTGIYVNDQPGRDWERYAEVSLFPRQGHGFAAPVGVRLQGNTGPTTYAKKSLRLFFRAGYGQAALQYPLYPADAVDSFQSLTLRSGYDDSLEPVGGASNGRPTLLRDPLVAELWRQAGGVTPRSRFVSLYLNRAYWGIYDLKETVDGPFVRDHLGSSDVDVMRARWDSMEVVAGDGKAWARLIDFMSSQDLADPTQFARASRLLDLDNYTTLRVLINATQYFTWGYGASAFRDRQSDGPWSWTVWDADRAFGDVNWNGLTDTYNPQDHDLDSLLTRPLLRNAGYRRDYLNRHADLLNTVFSADHVTALIDSLAAAIAAEVPAETARWGSSPEAWSANLARLRQFARARPTVVRQQLQELFGLAGQAQLTVGLAGAGASHARLRVNTVSVPGSSWSGVYFQGVPVSVQLEMDPGYALTGWSDPGLETRQQVSLTLTGDRLLTAQIEPETAARIELVTPDRVPPGQYLPLVVRLHRPDGSIEPTVQEPLTARFGSAAADTVLHVKRGAATGVVHVQGDGDIDLSLGNDRVGTVNRRIGLLRVPVVECAGALPSGETVWDSTVIHLVTGDITIPADGHLVIGPGTWVLARKYVCFYANGPVTVNGTATSPVVITSANWDEPWGGFEFTRAPADFRWCMVLNGGGDRSKGFGHTGHQHIFYAFETDFAFDQCFFLNSPGKVFGSQDSRVSVDHSVSAFVWHGGEFIETLLSYRNSHLMNIPNDDHIYHGDIDTDGFHIDWVNPKYPTYSVIDRCWFVTGKDDAIDHHGARLVVSNCWLEDFIHEGVAASGADTIKVFNTVAVGNDQGFEGGYTDSGIDDGPWIYLDHCVAVNNRVGLRIGDDYNWDVWGYTDHMTVSNCVLYNNQDNVLNWVNTIGGPKAGALSISNTMTNDTAFDGQAGCVAGVPLFDSLYYLQPASPGVGLGTGGSNLGRADSTTVFAPVAVISEIMHGSPPDRDSRDWVEVYNPGRTDLDLNGWTLTDANDSHRFVVPAGLVIAPKQRAVLCADSVAFRRWHPGVTNLAGDLPFGLGPVDEVRLLDRSGRLVDDVPYQSTSPWPDGTDHTGYTLELRSEDLDNARPDSWVRSLTRGGTPGGPNQVLVTVAEDVGALPQELYLGPNYPNPFNGATVLRFALPAAGRVQLALYDVLGQRLRVLLDEYRVAGQFTLPLAEPQLPSGAYLVRLEFTPARGAIQARTLRVALIK